MGTAVLILMGNGVVANVLLRKSKGEGAGWMVIATRMGVCGDDRYFHRGGLRQSRCASQSRSDSGGGVQPRAISASSLLYLPAQMLGAIVGQILVWLHYFPHWRETPDPDIKLACFCTSPAIRNPLANLVSEIIGTFVLVLVAGAIGSKAVAGCGLSAGVGPYLVSCLVWGIGLSLGGTTGYAINPARDLGPRIAHAILPIVKKGSSDWGYAPIPIFGPMIGAALAGLLLARVL